MPAASDQPHLVRSWWEYQQTLGRSKAEALRVLNAELDRFYTNSRFNLWLQGRASPDISVVDFMQGQLFHVELAALVSNYVCTNMRPDANDVQDIARTLLERLRIKPPSSNPQD